MFQGWIWHWYGLQADSKTFELQKKEGRHQEEASEVEKTPEDQTRSGRKWTGRKCGKGSSYIINQIHKNFD